MQERTLVSLISDLIYCSLVMTRMLIWQPGYVFIINFSSFHDVFCLGFTRHCIDFTTPRFFSYFAVKLCCDRSKEIDAGNRKHNKLN